MKLNGFALIEFLLYCALAALLMALVFANSANLLTHARAALKNGTEASVVYPVLNALRAQIHQTTRSCVVAEHAVTVFMRDQTVTFEFDSAHTRLLRKSAKLVGQEGEKQAGTNTILENVTAFDVASEKVGGDEGGKKEEAPKRSQKEQGIVIKMSHNDKNYVTYIFLQNKA